MFRSLFRPWKQYTYIKLHGTALTHALKSNTQFSLMFIALHDMSHDSCICPSLWLCWCFLSVHHPVENLSVFMCWQYKWQHGSSSTGSGVRGQHGRSNGVWRLSYDWQEEMMVVKRLFSQIDIKNRSVITVHVHIHGALLWSQADSTVLQGKRGAGCNIISLLRLVVHVNKDGGRGDCSHGGTLEEGRVCRDQIRTQVRTEHSLSVQTGQTASSSQPVPPVLLVPLICLRWKDLLWGRLQSRDGSTSPLWRGISNYCRANKG